MSGNPYESPDALGESPAREPGARGFRLVELLAVVAVILLLIALLLPAKRGAREAARRMSCSNNLKQIALALHNYAAENQCLPPAYTVDANGKPLHSWRTLILPYLEEQTLYEKIDLAKPWNDPANQEAYETVVAAYRCPSTNPPPNHTTYLAVVAPGACFRPAASCKLSEITDGPGSTLLVIDADSESHVHWMAPVDASAQQVLNFRTAAKLQHPGGFQAAFADGSVRFLASSLSTATLRALISIDGGDDPVAQEAD